MTGEDKIIYNYLELPPEGTDAFEFKCGFKEEGGFECVGINMMLQQLPIKTGYGPIIASIIKRFRESSFVRIMVKELCWLQSPLDCLPLHGLNSVEEHWLSTVIPKPGKDGKRHGIPVPDIRDLMVKIICVEPVTYDSAELDGEKIFIGIGLALEGAGELT